jgi:hypothetical protein
VDTSSARVKESFPSSFGRLVRSFTNRSPAGMIHKIDKYLRLLLRAEIELTPFRHRQLRMSSKAGSAAAKARDSKGFGARVRMATLRA